MSSARGHLLSPTVPLLLLLLAADTAEQSCVSTKVEPHLVSSSSTSFVFNYAFRVGVTCPLDTLYCVLSPDPLAPGYDIILNPDSKSRYSGVSPSYSVNFVNLEAYQKYYIYCSCNGEEWKTGNECHSQSTLFPPVNSVHAEATENKVTVTWTHSDLGALMDESRGVVIQKEATDIVREDDMEVMSRTIGDLKADTSYSWFIYYVTKDNVNGETTPFLFKTNLGKAVDPVKDFRIDKLTSTSVSVSWSASVTHGYDVTEYELTISGTVLKVPPSQLNYNVTALSPYTRYFISITALSPLGQSGVSPQIAFRSLADAPAPPNVVSAHVPGIDVVTIEYQYPLASGGCGIRDLIFVVTKSDGSTVCLTKIANDCSAAACSAEFSCLSLVSETNYTLGMLSTNCERNSTQMGRTVVVNYAAPLLNCDTFSNTTFLDTEVTLEWKAATQPLEIRSDLTYRLKGMDKSLVDEKDVFSMVVKELQPLNLYRFDLSVSNFIGRSKSCLLDYIASPPAPPSIEISAAEATTEQRCNSQFFNVTWPCVDAKYLVSSYSISYKGLGCVAGFTSPEIGICSITIPANPAGPCAYSIRGMEPNTEVAISVVATNHIGTSESLFKTLYTNPAKVSSGIEVSVDPLIYRVKVTTMDPKSGISDLHCFLKDLENEVYAFQIIHEKCNLADSTTTVSVYCRTSPSVVPLNRSSGRTEIGPTSCAFDLHSHLPGHHYLVFCSAVNVCGEGSPFSSEVTIKKSVPSAAASLVLKNDSTSSLQLQWAAADPFGAAITKYWIYQQMEGEAHFSVVASISGGSSDLKTSVGGLKESTRYRFFVVAENEAGIGPPSAATGYYLIGKTPVYLGAPRNLQVLIVDSSYSLIWDPPQNVSVPSAYAIYVRNSLSEIIKSEHTVDTFITISATESIILGIDVTFLACSVYSSIEDCSASSAYIIRGSLDSGSLLLPEPDAVPGIVISQVNETALSVEWGVPKLYGNQIMQYVLSIKDNDTQEKFTLTTLQLSFIYASAKPDHIYIIEVEACNVIGCGEALPFSFKQRFPGIPVIRYLSVEHQFLVGSPIAIWPTEFRYSTNCSYSVTPTVTWCDFEIVGAVIRCRSFSAAGFFQYPLQHSNLSIRLTVSCFNSKGSANHTVLLSISDETPTTFVFISSDPITSSADASSRGAVRILFQGREKQIPERPAGPLTLEWISSVPVGFVSNSNASLVASTLSVPTDGYNVSTGLLEVKNILIDRTPPDLRLKVVVKDQSFVSSFLPIASSDPQCPEMDAGGMCCITGVDRCGVCGGSSSQCGFRAQILFRLKSETPPTSADFEQLHRGLDDAVLSYLQIPSTQRFLNSSISVVVDAMMTYTIDLTPRAAASSADREIRANSDPIENLVGQLLSTTTSNLFFVNLPAAVYYRQTNSVSVISVSNGVCTWGESFSECATPTTATTTAEAIVPTEAPPSRLSAGAIAGIIIGVILLMLLVFGLCYIGFSRRTCSTGIIPPWLLCHSGSTGGNSPTLPNSGLTYADQQPGSYQRPQIQVVSSALRTPQSPPKPYSNSNTEGALLAALPAAPEVINESKMGSQLNPPTPNTSQNPFRREEYVTASPPASGPSSVKGFLFKFGKNRVVFSKWQIRYVEVSTSTSMLRIYQSMAIGSAGSFGVGEKQSAPLSALSTVQEWGGGSFSLLFLVAAPEVKAHVPGTKVKEFRFRVREQDFAVEYPKWMDLLKDIVRRNKEREHEHILNARLVSDEYLDDDAPLPVGTASRAVSPVKNSSPSKTRLQYRTGLDATFGDCTPASRSSTQTAVPVRSLTYDGDARPEALARQ